MKTWKLVAGILSIILSVFVFFQSVLVGTANTMSANGEVGVSAGVFVSIFMLAGGIVSIAVRNSQKKWRKYCSCYFIFTSKFFRYRTCWKF